MIFNTGTLFQVVWMTSLQLYFFTILHIVSSGLFTCLNGVQQFTDDFM